MGMTARKLIDCRGMQCPTPILHIAKAARNAGKEPAVLEVLVDDGDFPQDVQAWCRTSKSTLLGMQEKDGVYTARIGINGGTEEAQPKAPAANDNSRPRPTPPSPKPTAIEQELDCRGMRCPAPILQLANLHQSLNGAPSVVHITADDCEFPNDVKAWCKSTGANILSETQEGETSFVSLGLNGANQLASGGSQSQMRLAAGNAQPSPGPVAQGQEVPVMDLRGQRAPHPILQLSGMLATHAGRRLQVYADDPTFMTDVMGWAAATKVSVLSAQQNGATTTVELILGDPSHASNGALVPAAPAAPVVHHADEISDALMVVEEEGIAPRENRCTILVIRNDFESLMAAMLCATTAAAQGMEAAMYFSFWGVNMLRGERPRKDVKRGKVSFLQRIMKWMMPKGPSRQKMSKMHMGGMGKGMMQYFMRRNNVMSLEQMIDSAVQQNVRFVVCTMSMGIMGIEKRDLMDLPNLEFAGVTSFVELSQRSSSTLVF